MKSSTGQVPKGLRVRLTCPAGLGGVLSAGLAWGAWGAWEASGAAVRPVNCSRGLSALGGEGPLLGGEPSRRGGEPPAQARLLNDH